MEVCGTHTHEIFKQGIRNLLPENVELISGPGCPVCVTPVGFIDEALWLAENKNCTICTFGDLVRVPGTEKSLADIRAEGKKVEMVYSPLDALSYAKDHPKEQVVFLSVGFETTTPASCVAVRNGKKANIKNFSLLTANKTMDNAYRFLKGSADAFLYPGHVAALTGTAIFKRNMEEGISGTIAGFTGTEILTAIAVILKKSEKGNPFFVNCYPRVVTDEGSQSGRKLIEETFDSIDSEWRGLGVIKDSGLNLKSEYINFDARAKYEVPKIKGKPNPGCRCGDVLLGKCKPNQCPLFGQVCNPEKPVGACMVSGEGACSAFYKYGGLLK